MRKLILLAMAVVGVASQAAATVIDFDDLVGSGGVPPGYAGFASWGGWNYYDSSQPPYNPHSGLTRVYVGDEASSHILVGSDIVFTFTGAVIAATVGSLPFVVKASRAAIEEVDPKLQQAARTLGAGPLRVFFTVTLPLASRGVIAGTMLAWAKALGDFGITLMMVGMRVGDTSPASIFIYGELNAGSETAARNMSIVMTLIAVTIMFAVNRMTRRRREH